MHSISHNVYYVKLLLARIGYYGRLLSVFLIDVLLLLIVPPIEFKGFLLSKTPAGTPGSATQVREKFSTSRRVNVLIEVFSGCLQLYLGSA